MKFLRYALIVLVILGAGVALALALDTPEPLAVGTESAARLEPGPYAVDLSEEVWVDASRPTNANGDFEGSEERTFKIALWSPVEAPGPHPLLVYSHGFMSNRHGGQYLAEHMASHGYVVVATDYPLTTYTAPGGPNANDVENQPGDVSFLIDQALSLARDARSFAGGIDRDRIGVMGLSLGGLTTTLAAFHPGLGDPRIKAAISIAGPSAMFGRGYFAQADVPFLMIAGTHDSMIEYNSNAAPIPELIKDGGLITIDGASHAGFSAIAAGPMRLLGNPDALGCESLMANLDIAPDENPFPGLGGPEIGMLDASGTPLPCSIRFDEAMHPGRQHMATTLAVRAFFESHFSRDASDRDAHASFLTATLQKEFAELSFAPPKRS